MRGAVVLSLLALVLAGCTGDGGKAPAAVGDNPANVKVDPASDRGAISGIVVDDAVYPLHGANVTLGLGDGTRKTTTQDGVFAFEGLEPGAYFVTATLAGYAGPSSAIQVAAGQVTYARLQLARVAGDEPYHYTLHMSGYIQASPALAGAVADAFFDSFGFLVPDNPFCKNCVLLVETAGLDVQDFVLDGHWQTTAPPVTADDLFLSVMNANSSLEKPGYGAAIESPTLIHLSPDDAAFVGGPSDWWRFQVSGSLEQPNYSQQYDLFITVFVNGPAPAGWSLAAGDV